MEKKVAHSTEFYEMWSSIYTLEAYLKSSPIRAVKMGNSTLWRSLWDEASAKITAYLRSTTVAEGIEGSQAFLSEERLKLQNEIQKISIFTAEAGDALWKNSAALFLVSSNIGCLLRALRAYLEQERRFVTPPKGAAA